MCEDTPSLDLLTIYTDRKKHHGEINETVVFELGFWSAGNKSSVQSKAISENLCLLKRIGKPGAYRPFIDIN